MCSPSRSPLPPPSPPAPSRCTGKTSTSSSMYPKNVPFYLVWLSSSLLLAYSSRGSIFQKRRICKKGLTALWPSSDVSLEMVRPVWWLLPHISLELTHLAAPHAGNRLPSTAEMLSEWHHSLSSQTWQAHLIDREVNSPLQLFSLLVCICVVNSALITCRWATTWSSFLNPFLPGYYS